MCEKIFQFLLQGLPILLCRILRKLYSKILINWATETIIDKMSKVKNNENHCERVDI